DALGEKTAVVVGHDWGAIVAWQCLLLHPSRFTGLVAMSVPYGGRPPEPIAETLRKPPGATSSYLPYFQRPGPAAAGSAAAPRAPAPAPRVGPPRAPPPPPPPPAARPRRDRSEARRRRLDPAPRRSEGAAELAHPGGSRLLRRRVHHGRLSRGHQLLSELS